MRNQSRQLNDTDSRTRGTGPGWAAVAAGALVLLAAKMGVCPNNWLSKLMADDGLVSESFLELQRMSQICLGWALIIAAIPTWWSQWPQQAHRLLQRASAGRVRWMVCTCSFFLALFAQEILFDGIPHVTDATSHLFQTNILALNRLAVPAPPCPEAFFQHNVIISSRNQWHTKYYPGQALWLAIGKKLGCMPLMMPLAFSLLILAFYELARRLVSPATASLAAIFLVTSPLCILLAGSYMSHITVYMFAGVGLLFLLPMLEDRAGAWHHLAGIGAGFWWGWGFLTRPQDFIVVAGMGGAIGLLHKATRHKLWHIGPWLAMGALPALLLLGAWNHQLYGHFFASGYNFSSSFSQTPIIHDRFGFGDGFTVATAFKHLFWTLLRFNQAMLGWPCSLWLALLALLLAKNRKLAAGCAGGAAGCALPYFFFHYYGFEYEARYWTGCIPFLAVLSAMGAARLAQAGRQRPLFWLITAGYLYSAGYYWPTYLWPTYAKDYEQASRVLDETAKHQHLDNALVLIPSEGTDAFRYSSGFIFNDPELQNPTIYARDLGAAKNDCLFQAFPSRTIYRFWPEEAWQTGRLERIHGPSSDGL